METVIMDKASTEQAISDKEKEIKDYIDKCALKISKISPAIQCYDNPRNFSEPYDVTLKGPWGVIGFNSNVNVTIPVQPTSLPLYIYQHTVVYRIYMDKSKKHMSDFDYNGWVVGVEKDGDWSKWKCNLPAGNYLYYVGGEREITIHVEPNADLMTCAPQDIGKGDAFVMPGSPFMDGSKGSLFFLAAGGEGYDNGEFNRWYTTAEYKSGFFSMGSAGWIPFMYTDTDGYRYKYIFNAYRVRYFWRNNINFCIDLSIPGNIYSGDLTGFYKSCATYRFEELGFFNMFHEWKGDADFAVPSAPTAAPGTQGTYHFVGTTINTDTTMTINGASYPVKIDTDDEKQYCGMLDVDTTLKNGDATDLSNSFKDQDGITTIDLSPWDVSNVTTTTGMFSGCDALLIANLSGWNLAKCTDTTDMFKGCDDLRLINLTGCDADTIKKIKDAVTAAGLEDVKYQGEPMSYEYSLTSAGWGTLVIPFNCEKPSGVDWVIYRCTGIDASTGKLKLSEESTFKANTPYIIKGTAATVTLSGTTVPHANACTDGIMTGVYKEMPAAIGSYIMQKNDGVLAFYKVDEEYTLSPYRCYINKDAGTVDSAMFPS